MRGFTGLTTLARLPTNLTCSLFCPHARELPIHGAVIHIFIEAITLCMGTFSATTSDWGKHKLEHLEHKSSSERYAPHPSQFPCYIQCSYHRRVLGITTSRQHSGRTDGFTYHEALERVSPFLYSILKNGRPVNKRLCHLYY